jgi:hypothetical protein
VSILPFDSLDPQHEPNGPRPARNPALNLARMLGDSDPGTDSPDVLRLQPLPATVMVAQIVFGREPVTAISRTWKPGDADRCRLCPKCHAYDNRCMIVTNSLIPDSETALYKLKVPSFPGVIHPAGAGSRGADRRGRD